MEADRTVQPLQTDFRRTTDEQGRLRWENAPPGEHTFSIYASGYMALSGVNVNADGQEHDIELAPALTVFGSVRDAVTGQLLPRCRIATGYFAEWNGITNYYWSTIDRFWFDAPGGTFRHVLNEPVIGDVTESFVFKFVVDGYAPFISRAVEPDEGEVRLDVAIASRHKPARDRVVDERAAGGSRGHRPGLAGRAPGVDDPSGFSHQNPQSAGVLLSTDDQGQFSLPPDDAIQRVIAASASGYAEANIARLLAEPVLRLQSWGRLEGTYRTNGQPVAGVGLSFSPG